MRFEFSFTCKLTPRNFSVKVVRPDDLLILTLDFYNIRLQGSGPGPLQVDRVAAGDGFIVAHFQPQSFGEQGIFEASPGVPVPSDPLVAPSEWYRADFQREDARENLNYARRTVYADAIPLG